MSPLIAVPFDRPDIPFEPSRTLDVDARHWRYYTQHGPTSWRPPWQHCCTWLQKVAQRLHLCGRGRAGGSSGSGGAKQGWDEEAGAADSEAGKHKRVGSGGSGSQVGSGSGGSGGVSGTCSSSQAGLAAEAAEEGSTGSTRSEMEAWRAEKTHRHRSLLGLPMISPGDPQPAVLAVFSDMLCHCHALRVGAGVHQRVKSTELVRRFCACFAGGCCS